MNKKNILIFTLYLIFFQSVFSDSNGVWHKAEDVSGGIFGLDEENKNFSFMGNLGIGIKKPQIGLHIDKNIFIGKNLSLEGVLIKNDDTHFAIRTNNQLGKYDGSSIFLGRNSEKNSIILRTHSSDKNSFINFQNNNTENLAIIRSDGNIGINTNNPRTNLEITGRWFVTSHGKTPESGKGLFGSYNTILNTGIIQSYDYTNSKPQDLSIQSAGGNLGIGEYNPEIKLHIKEKTEKLLKLENHKGQWGFGIGDNIGEGNFFIGNFGLDTRPFVIDKNSNIGIGTSNPTQKLDVNGKIRMRVETQDTDSDDTVVTKSYVDDLVAESLNYNGVPVKIVIPIGQQFVQKTRGYWAGGKNYADNTCNTIPSTPNGFTYYKQGHWTEKIWYHQATCEKYN